MTVNSEASRSLRQKWRRSCSCGELAKAQSISWRHLLRGEGNIWRNTAPVYVNPRGSLIARHCYGQARTVRKLHRCLYQPLSERCLPRDLRAPVVLQCSCQDLQWKEPLLFVVADDDDVACCFADQCIVYRTDPECQHLSERQLHKGYFLGAAPRCTLVRKMLGSQRPIHKEEMLSFHKGCIHAQDMGYLALIVMKGGSLVVTGNHENPCCSVCMQFSKQACMHACIHSYPRYARCGLPLPRST